MASLLDQYAERARQNIIKNNPVLLHMQQAGINMSHFRPKAELLVAEQLKLAKPAIKTTADTARKDAVKAVKDKSGAEQKTAVQQYMQQTKQAAAAAKQTMKKPVGGVATFNANTLKPLQAVTGVKLDKKLAGANKGSGQFYTAPEDSAAKFSVGAPVGGGDVGVRQKATTAQVSSAPDNLGSRKKEF